MTVVVDSGALLALAKGKREAVALMKKMQTYGAYFVVPAPVLAETLRGSQRNDAAIFYWLRAFEVEPTTAAIARTAGEILGACRSKSTVDAIVVATARICGASEIITSDPKDIRTLVDRTVGILAV